MNDAFFEKALSQTLKNEGVLNGKTGYVNSKNDSGGETNYGITKAKARECGYNGKMCDLPYETAKQIYYNEYWKKTNAGNIHSFNISFLLFDFAVNAGVTNASKKLQTAINKTLKKNVLKIDGIIGEKTIEELNFIIMSIYYSFKDLEKIFIAEILGYYTSLAKFNIYGKGWINRIIKNVEFLNNG